MRFNIFQFDATEFSKFQLQKKPGAKAPGFD